jgi:restriction endonuclease Mrr
VKILTRRTLTSTQIVSYESERFPWCDGGPGLFITTGTFTPAAVKEATRDGAPPIDLLDGGDVADKLRELSLGVRIENIEVIRIEEQWFESV